ncbi:hypothetical protein CFC21_050455 [Triticum aestivum]|uniref:Uncharacterized protein n=3 Tax=Triticinae TaxID=1648030 RepID=A0A3B6H2I2_WHEAT|nr:uncharacterized protein LOC109758398 [Aegilops tauschii subsp. strangulata]XP_044354265.1 uncharacterized protein LOC123075813 [Triticum aestivum]KAF7040563.1 hypothetical protein CFC21_050455 [Triticum aestivum]
MLSSSCSVAACGVRAFRLLAVAAVRLPMLLFCDAMVWAVTFLTFPVRLLAAADRERKLERLVGEMQGQMERVVWENRDLEQRLRTALKENATMEGILDEMEEENEEAFARIDLLESQLKALKKENMRLKEQRGKSVWDKAAATATAATVAVAGNGGGKKKPGETRAWEGQEEEEEDAPAQRDQPVVFRPGDLDAFPPSEARDQLLRATARRRSLFSLGMSLAVGGIAWSADAPCLPLLAGLVGVVAMSMCSVSRLFRAPADHRVLPPASAASDGAVALLSLNWFLLGVLTYPMLPGVARAVVPRAARLAGPAIAWLAAAVPV